MTNSKILLTGHRGFIGSALHEALLKTHSADVVAVLSDLRDARALASEIGQLECDGVLVLHFATINRGKCLGYEDHATNCAMLLNLVRATAHFSQRQFLFASSTDVFAAPAALPLTETSPHRPQDWYALSKSVGEWILERENVPHATFRLPGIFGARPDDASLVGCLLRKGVASGSITLTAQGETLRDFVYLDDLIALVLDWLRLPRVGCWNIASGRSLPIAEALTRLRELQGACFHIELSDERTARDFDLVFDTTRLRQDFPATPIRAFSETCALYSRALEALNPAAAS